MVVIEMINYTFFIIRTFEWQYLFLFAFAAVVGIVSTHIFALILRKTTVFKRDASYIWTVALISCALISLWLNLATNLPALATNTRETLPEIFKPINLLAGIINWGRYVLVWIIIYFMYQLMKRNKSIEQEKLKTESIARLTELELLKTQLNPHFLFNALNTIKALVTIDPEKSKDAIVKLSELLRFTLHYGGHETISFHEELEQVKKYLSLEKIRFGNRLTIEYDIDENCFPKLIPPALILTLAENAIKHGISKQAGSGTVRISAFLKERKALIEVANSGKLVTCSETGIGLKHVRRRMERAYGRYGQFSITEKANFVVASIEFTI